MNKKKKIGVCIGCIILLILLIGAPLLQKQMIKNNQEELLYESIDKAINHYSKYEQSQEESELEKVATELDAFYQTLHDMEKDSEDDLFSSEVASAMNVLLEYKGNSQGLEQLEKGLNALKEDIYSDIGYSWFVEFVNDNIGDDTKSSKVKDEEEEQMYTFKKGNRDTSEQMYGRNVATLLGLTDSQEYHAFWLGKVKTLFGEPDYTTPDMEDMFSCAIVAEKGEDVTIPLEIYYGPSGPAIAGPEGEEADQAIRELAEQIIAAEPADYEWSGVYEDIPVEVKMGVKDGIPYYESPSMEIPEGLSEEEMEAYFMENFDI